MSIRGKLSIDFQVVATDTRVNVNHVLVPLRKDIKVFIQEVLGFFFSVRWYIFSYLECLGRVLRVHQEALQVFYWVVLYSDSITKMFNSSNTPIALGLQPFRCLLVQRSIFWEHRPC